MSLGEYPVLACTGTHAFISGPDDFSLGAGRAVDASRMFEPDVSPYCFDTANRTLICVSTSDISDATFFYQAQRQHAFIVHYIGDAPFRVTRRGANLQVMATELDAVAVREIPVGPRSTARRTEGDRAPAALLKKPRPGNVIGVHMSPPLPKFAASTPTWPTPVERGSR